MRDRWRRLTSFAGDQVGNVDWRAGEAFKDQPIVNRTPQSNQVDTELKSVELHDERKRKGVSDQMRDCVTGEASVPNVLCIGRVVRDQDTYCTITAVEGEEAPHPSKRL